MTNHVIARALAAALLLALAGCAAGPDFKRPAAPPVQRYTAEPLAAATESAPVAGGGAQRFAQGADVPADWWKLFGSSALDRIVAAALKANPDLQSAEAALRAARESTAAQRGALLPTADLQFTPTRQRIADPLASPLESNKDLYSLHTAQLNIGYSVDAFGGTRRQIEASEAQSEVARFQRDAAWLTLTANVATTAIGEAALRAQLKVTQDLVAMARRQLDAVRRQQALGQLGAAEVAAQEAALAQAESALPALEKQLAEQSDQLAVLGGRFPADEHAPGLEFEALVLPAELPLSLPARLVEQRPDVRAAEAQLHAASAQAGVAAAARLPTIALTASLGSTALDLGSLFKTGTGFWSIGADLVQPLFKGGALKHQQKAAEAQYEQAAAQYRGAVLLAFQDVARALHAIESDARALRIAHDAERAALRSLAIATKQLDLGLIAYPAVLQAQQGYQQAATALIQAQAARYADTVALFQALGGGWWNRAGHS